MSYKPWHEDINEIKRRCRSSGELFEDLNFPAVDSSLFYSTRPPRPLEWKRPGEIVEKPCMYVDGASRLDINQGMLGDCWMLAAIAALTHFPSLFERVLPSGQEFDHEYCGAFLFNFWHEGKWIEVIIDDRLPTYKNSLVFTHSKERNEFWSALLEKAYAKLNGSYEALKGGQTIEAMEDFTGGLGDSIELGAKTPANLFKIMQKALSMGSLMACSISAKPHEIEAKLANGLVKGHAYTVTGAEKVNARIRSGSHIEVELVRIRNPWGNEREWRGAWGDGSHEWKLLSDEEKRALNLIFEDDGEFWMSLRDFVTNFSSLEVCMLGPDSSLAGEEKKNWEGRSEFGRWRRGVTAGGCRNFIDTFARNPQFRVDLEDPDDDNDEVDNCSFVVALMQIGRRKLKASEGKPYLTIGFVIYQVEEKDLQDGVLNKEFFKYHASVARSKVFINSREIVGRFSLPPGSYAVVPSTYKPNEEGDFLLRLYSEKEHETKHCDVQTTMKNSFEDKPAISREQGDSMDSKLRSLFPQLAGDDMEIDAFELREILSSAFKKEMHGEVFSLEACRSLVNLKDTDCSGKLGYDEFKDTWLQLMKWRRVFDKHDADKTGDFNTWELRDALKEIGITLDSDTLVVVSSRFRNKKDVTSFDDYVQIVVRLHAMYDAFQKHLLNGDKAVFSLKEFLWKTVTL